MLTSQDQTVKDLIYPLLRVNIVVWDAKGGILGNPNKKIKKIVRAAIRDIQKDAREQRRRMQEREKQKAAQKKRNAIAQRRTRAQTHKRTKQKKRNATAHMESKHPVYYKGKPRSKWPGRKREDGTPNKVNQTCYSWLMQHVIDQPEEFDDDSQLAIIERELDNTGPDGPYRGARARLNRMQQRILDRKSGSDPMVFATGRSGEFRTLRGQDRANYTLKRQVNLISKELERREREKWWERYK
jgi:hypothetical protein